METFPNGFAQVDYTSHVSSDSFADSSSAIRESSSVIHSSLFNSQIELLSTVYSSVLKNSKALRSVVIDARVTGCILEHSVISGLFGLNPELTRVSLQDCVVEGGVRLVGPWALSGNARIHEGTWFRAPRVKPLAVSLADGQVLRVTLTECINGRALIACRCHDMRRWQAIGPRLGRMIGWPAELVRETWLTFDEWLQDVSYM